MADKKITALDALDAAGKATDDLLHIIDYGGGSSPINKKITIANLFSRVDTPLTSIGAYNLEFGATSTKSVLKANIPNATPASGAESEVVINDGADQYVDFRVETAVSPKAIFVDSTTDATNGTTSYVQINGSPDGSATKVDFQVNSVTGILIHTDATDHSIGIGNSTPSGDFIMDITGDGVIVDSTCDTTDGSTAMAMTSSASITVGDRIFGPGIKSGTTVSAKPTGTSVTLSAAATATGTDSKITFVQASKKGHSIQSNGSIAMGAHEEIRSTEGNATVSNLVPVTKLVTDDGNTRTLTMSTTDAVDGQMKYIYVSSEPAAGEFTLQLTNVDGMPAGAVVSLQTIGHSATLIFDGTTATPKWRVLGIQPTTALN